MGAVTLVLWLGGVTWVAGDVALVEVTCGRCEWGGCDLGG